MTSKSDLDVAIESWVLYVTQLHIIVTKCREDINIILGISDNYRQATQANLGDPPADKDPVKAENPK